MRRSLSVFICFWGFLASAQFVEKPIKIDRLNSIHFYNSQVGFAGGAGMARTTNGGETWTPIKFTNNDSIFYITQINHVFSFQSPLDGVAVTFSLFHGGGAVMKTNDGGTTWRIAFADAPLENPVDLIGFQDVHFFDDNNGFAVGADGRRIITTDGGENWTRNDLPFQVTFFDIYFVNAQVGYLAGTEMVLKTIDGGTTWTQISNLNFSSITFTDELTGHAAANDGMYKTTDGGLNWVKYPVPVGYPFKVVFANDQIGYAIGSFAENANKIIRTDNGGALWELVPQEFSTNPSDLVFLSPTVGFLGATGNALEPHFYKTTNGTGLTKPVAYFDYPTGQNCLNQVIPFTNHGQNNYQHAWYVDNVLMSNSYNYSHTFNSAGTHTVKLVTSNNGYSSTYTRSVYISAPITFSPISAGAPESVCIGKPFSIFVLSPNSALNYELWDGNTLLGTGSGWQTIYFPITGGINTSTTFTIKTTPVYDMCATTLPTKSLFVLALPENPELDVEVNPGPVLCEVEKPFDVIIHNSIVGIQYNIENFYHSGLYYREGNGGDLVFQNVMWLENTQLKVVARTPCSIVSKTITMGHSPIQAKFKLATQGLFMSEGLNIINQSTGTDFTWNFGTDAQPATSADQFPQTVSYGSVGLKNISLTVHDQYGCTRTADTTLLVTTPVPDLAVTECVNQTTAKDLRKYYPTDSKVDGQGNVLQTGYFEHGLENPGGFGGFLPSAMFLHKYDPSGNLIWKKEVDPLGGVTGGSNYHGSYGRGVTTDNAGNVYVLMDFNAYQIQIGDDLIGYTGYMFLYREVPQQVALLKYSSDGELLWKILGYDPQMRGRDFQKGVDLEFTPEGDLYFITGSSRQYDHTGQMQFVNTTLTVNTLVGVMFGAYSLFKITPEGYYKNHWGFGGDSGIVSTGYLNYDIPKFQYWPRMTVDQDSRILISGIYRGGYMDYQFGPHTLSQPTRNIFIAIFQHDAWQGAFTGPEISPSLDAYIGHYFDYITVDTERQLVYLSGRFDLASTWINPAEHVLSFDNTELIDNVNSYITCWSYSGTRQWTKFHKGVVTRGLLINPATGQLNAVGTLEPFASFNSLDPNPTGIRSNGGRDPFIAAYDATNGSLIGVTSLGTAEDEVLLSSGDLSCDRITLLGSKGSGTFIKGLSPSGSCARQAPVLSGDTHFVICESDSVQMNISGADSYFWSPNTPEIIGRTTANPWIKPLPDYIVDKDLVKHYTVIGRSQGGCSSSLTVEVRVQKHYVIVNYQPILNSYKIPFSVTYPTEGDVLWEFSDGETVEGRDIEHTFPNTGLYHFTVSASNACGPLTETLEIPISCSELQMNVTEQHEPGTTLVSFQAVPSEALTWHWDFGDGTTSTDENPVHQYTEPGTYEVRLIGANRCSADTIDYPLDISPCDIVQSHFTYAKDNMRVTFTIDPGNTHAVFWSFGDGTTSPDYADFEPTHEYAESGVYQVCLNVLYNCGTEISCQEITVGCPKPTAAFTYTTGNMTLTPVNTTLRSESVLWDFGDGTTSTAFQPAHPYAVPGTYTICLTATNACGTQSICQDVTIVCPFPITANIQTSANSNLKVTLANNSTGFTSVAWDFGDGTSSTATAPTHTYAQAGTYTICAVLKNSCKEVTTCLTATVTCTPPTAYLSYSANQKTLTFTNQSINYLTSSWDFGDGTTTSATNPVHTYVAPGTYTVRLTVTNACGTTSWTTYQITVTCNHGIVPALNFTTTAQVLSITNTTTAATQFAWTFGDGQTSAEKSPTHQYQAEGTYAVCVTMSNLCGSITTCQNVIITCTNPIADFNFSLDALSATFSNQSTSSSSFQWDFGDGNTSTASTPTHTYAASGEFMVCLTAKNECQEEVQKCLPLTITVTGLEPVGLTLHPNPFTNQFTVSAPGKRVLCIEVHSQTGALVASVPCLGEVGEFKISLPEISPGLYLVKIMTEHGPLITKVVKL